MDRRPAKVIFALGLILSCCLLLPSLSGSPGWNLSQDSKAASSEKKSGVYPRGVKLVLTDGTYQLVREYERNGEHVRYFSMERGAWEELPASLVDWGATAKAEAEMEKQSAELVEKAHKQEEARRMDNVSDIDASLRVGDGVFLSSCYGFFVVVVKLIFLFY
jgi:hypothetical protein